MCKACKPIKAYQTVDNADQLNSIKEKAYSLVDEGAFTLRHDFTNETADYSEVQFHCEECGRIHVLWLHTFMCRTGGEWREVSA